MKNKMNKKGFMLGEYTLKVIIAIFCIILLLYLLFSFYSSFTDKKNINGATSTLNDLSEKMIDAKNEQERVTLPLLEPNGWRLIGYSTGDRPEQCTGNCICLCADRWRDRWFKDQIEKCEAIGVCRNFDVNINTFNIKIRTDVNIDYDRGYVITENRVISDKV